jgi:dephospho-CoA kinase
MNKKLRIGITGGIASGKSLVCDFIENEGFIVLRADSIAKDLMASDEKIKKKLTKTFGDDSYINGKPNTKFLAEEVFTSQENVDKVNSIIHPPVLEIIETNTNEILKNNSIVFVESALIYEAKFQKMFDHVILICADENKRIERSIGTKGSNAEEIKRRMAFQLKDEIKKEKASFVIENNSSVEELKVRVSFVLNLLRTLAS